MAQLVINVGTGENTGDGDTLRAALVKANTNFKNGKLLLTKSNHFDFPKKLNLIETPDLDF